jgi:hypothetical protein
MAWSWSRREARSYASSLGEVTVMDVDLFHGKDSVTRRISGVGNKM